MESDEEDYVFFGTPIEREEEISSRKKKAVAEASGHLRTLPSWKQEVRDEEGRRRFHGAFTGGFSAGYYNTVGSKEGWVPQSFTSSRKNRAEVKKQSILNFLDEEEKEDLEGRFLGTSSQFDTFGFTAAEIARKQAEKEQQERPSIIPGPAPDELVLPATESVGVKLLLKMGWRHGRPIKDSHANALHDARREARRAFLAFSSDDPKVQLTDSEPIKCDKENVFDQSANDVQSSKSTPVYVLNPKQDLYGLGFDPYKNAPEFREKKRSRVSGERGPGYNKKDSLFGFKSGKSGPGFGIGALEELDAEDEDVYATGYEFEETYIEEDEEASNLSLENKKKLDKKHEGVLPGFRVASNSDYRMDRFEAPVIPKDFLPHHTFSGPLEIDLKHYDAPPPEVPPPEDGTLKLLIEGVASLVARSGKKFEDLYREKNKSNLLFNFLSGGTGHDYYTRKLWEKCQKRSDQTGEQLDGKVPPSVQRLTAESRGKILGEKPLEKSFKDPFSSVSSTDIHLQLNLSDTFTKSVSFSDLPEVEKPFKDDPAKQERFDQFLKQKYEGGLRSMISSLASNMSETARARERLDFEAAAEAIEKGKQGKGSKPSVPSLLDFSTAGVLQFTSGGPELKKDPQTEDYMAKKMYPKREEFQWRPSPLLCKRFDLIDPYMGKPPPAPRIRSKMDSLILTSDFVKASKTDEAATGKKSVSPLQQSENQDSTKDSAEHVAEVEVEVENVERPVDLYKAIFSDDSDEEVEDSNLNRVDNQEKKAEIANTALSRLIAGDFLESLGKELGLEVPPDKPYPAQKSQNSALEKETTNANARANPAKVENIKDTSLNEGLPHLQDIAQKVGSSKSESNSSRTKGTSMDDNKSSKLNGKKDEEDRKTRTPSTCRRDYSNSSSSSEEERSRKRSRRHQHRSHDSGSDSSSEDRDRYSSRSKRKHKSSREKSKESRKQSRNHKHRSWESLSRSHYGMKKSRSDNKREKKRKD